MLALLLFACSDLPYHARCEVTEEPLDVSDESVLGVSGQDLLDSAGDQPATVSISWTGKHSQSPKDDVFEISWDPTAATAMQVVWTPTQNSDASEEDCATDNRFSVTMPGSLVSQDGQVQAEGVTSFALVHGQAVDELRIGAGSDDAILSEERLVEAESFVGARSTWSEPPQIVLAAGGDADLSYIEIENTRIWKCDEGLDQRNPSECSSWE